MDNTQKTEEILLVLNQVFENTREALRLLNLNEEQVQLLTSKYPSFSMLSTPTLEQLVKGIQKAFITVLHSRGLSQREIAKRLGGSSQNTVFLAIKQLKLVSTI